MQFLVKKTLGRRAGSTPFSVKKFPLTFQENLFRDGPGGWGEVPPLTESFRDLGY